MPKKVLLAPPENIMVQAENLVKIYKSRDVEVMALQGLDLTVERGELMGIVGARRKRQVYIAEHARRTRQAISGKPLRRRR